MNNNDAEKCWIYKGWRTQSGKNIIPLGYEGIPQNLLLNVAGWVVLIIVFSVLRKKAWNYGRIAFYKYDENPEERGQNDELLKGVASENPTGKRPSTSQSNGVHTRHHDTNSAVVNDDGFFSWMLTVVKLTDEQILAKSGPDAVHYLSFQRHLIFIGCVVTVVSIVIVLPINFQGGTLQSDITQFKSSTISNLGTSSKLLWVHVALTLVYLTITVAVLRHFSKSLAVSDSDPVISRTVMISRIAKRNTRAEKLESHFLEIYPEIEIEEICFAYNISELRRAETNKLTAASARAYWEKYFALKKRRPLMRPYTCGKLCCCCSICGLKPVDAIDYYIAEEAKYTEEVEKEIKKALARPLGIAFVTFATTEWARRVVKDYRLCARLMRQRPHSQFSRKLKSDNWVVNYAPLPEDIYWENISLSYKAWYFKAILVNAMLLMIVVVYSTPVHILNALDNISTSSKDGNGTTDSFKYKIQDWGSYVTAGLAADTAPTFLLWVTAVSLPSLVSVSDRIVGFWTRTSENRSRMIKTFTFLLFMVIILPSLGAQSFYYYFTGSAITFRCIFYVGNSVFFMNYIITSSFLGTASELMRLPELFYYAVKVCFSKSSAEIDSIRKASVWDFQFGSQYAWTMLNFTMFIFFSLISPLITPFGLVYIIMKHYVDRYNVYFAYAPCKVDKEVHITAINFALVSMFLLQIIILAYTTQQSYPNAILKVFSIIGFCITTAFFISQVFFNICTNFSPISYIATSEEGKILEEMEAAKITDLKAENSTTLASDDTDDTGDVPSVRFNHLHRKSLAYRNGIEADQEPLGRYFPKILRTVNFTDVGNLESSVFLRNNFSYSVSRAGLPQHRREGASENVIASTQTGATPPTAV